VLAVGLCGGGQKRESSRVCVTSLRALTWIASLRYAFLSLVLSARSMPSRTSQLHILDICRVDLDAELLVQDRVLGSHGGRTSADGGGGGDGVEWYEVTSDFGSGRRKLSETPWAVRENERIDWI
jgi:hypothetical protein